MGARTASRLPFAHLLECQRPRVVRVEEAHEHICRRETERQLIQREALLDFANIENVVLIEVNLVEPKPQLLLIHRHCCRRSTGHARTKPKAGDPSSLPPHGRGQRMKGAHHTLCSHGLLLLPATFGSRQLEWNAGDDGYVR